MARQIRRLSLADVVDPDDNGRLSWPGYVIVQLPAFDRLIADEIEQRVKGVRSFLEDEVDFTTRSEPPQITEVEINPNALVTLLSGPFTGQYGRVTEVNLLTGEMKVSITVFNRPVEIPRVRPEWLVVI